MRLTQKTVDGLALDRDRVLWDDELPGLGLRVQAGRRTWIVRYRVAGAQRQKSLPGALPLRQARAHAAEIRALAARGSDVVRDGRAAADAARRRAEGARARSLGLLAEHYLAEAARRLRPASLKPARLYLAKHWRALHDRPADELGRREIVATLEPYAGRATAAQMLAHLSACLSWGVERGLLERNAVTGIKPPVQRVARERVLTDGEVRAVWAATAEDTAGPGADGEYDAIVRLLLLTGQRRQEVGGLRWAELDLDKALWRLPGERTKNGRPHDVPLPAQAVAILRAVDHRGKVRDGCVFGRPGGPGFRAWDGCKRRLDRRSEVAGWRLHDLRRTAVTGMAELGVAPHVVEAVVNHVSGHKAGVAGVYNRAVYAAEKRAALQLWADHLERLVAGEAAADAVVAFGR